MKVNLFVDVKLNESEKREHFFTQYKEHSTVGLKPNIRNINSYTTTTCEIVLVMSSNLYMEGLEGIFGAINPILEKMRIEFKDKLEKYGFSNSDFRIKINNEKHWDNIVFYSERIPTEHEIKLLNKFLMDYPPEASNSVPLLGNSFEIEGDYIG